MKKIFIIATALFGAQWVGAQDLSSTTGELIIRKQPNGSPAIDFAIIQQVPIPAGNLGTQEANQVSFSVTSNSTLKSVQIEVDAQRKNLDIPSNKGKRVYMESIPGTTPQVTVYVETQSGALTRATFQANTYRAEQVTSEGSLLSIIRAEQSGSRINIYYDLVDTDVSNEYSINIYSSFDDFKQPLKTLSGAGGAKVTTGRNRVITWDMSEYGSSFGENLEALSFEVRAGGFKPYLTLNQKFGKMQRHEPYILMWSVSQGEKLTTIELVHNLETVWSDVARGESYLFYVPEPAKGGTYFLRFKSRDDPTHPVLSNEFSIKGKLPLYVKMIPVAAVGVGYLVLQLTKEKPAPRLPDPALPPE